METNFFVTLLFLLSVNTGKSAGASFHRNQHFCQPFALTYSKHYKFVVIATIFWLQSGTSFHRHSNQLTKVSFVLFSAGRSLMVKKNDGIKESTDSSNTIEDDGNYCTWHFRSISCEWIPLQFQLL